MPVLTPTPAAPAHVLARSLACRPQLALDAAAAEDRDENARIAEAFLGARRQ